MRHGHGLTTSSRNPQQQQQQQRQRQRHSTQTLVSFPFFSFSFFSSSFLEFGPRPDELGTRVKPWRGPAPFEFVTPGIEQHRDRSDGTRYNSFSIPPSELNVAPGEPLEIAWPSGRGERGGKRFSCRDWTTIFSFYSGCYEIVEGPPAYLCSYSSPFSFFSNFPPPDFWNDWNKHNFLYASLFIRFPNPDHPPDYFFRFLFFNFVASNSLFEWKFKSGFDGSAINLY